MKSEDLVEVMKYYVIAGALFTFFLTGLLSLIQSIVMGTAGSPFSYFWANVFLAGILTFVVAFWFKGGKYLQK